MTTLEAIVRESIAEADVPALGAAYVRNGARESYVFQGGSRRADRPSADPGNAVLSTDRFDIGSIGKPITGLLLARMIDRGEHGLTYETPLGQVFPQLGSEVNSPHVASYLTVRLKHLMTHSSGMPYNPSREPGDQWMPTDDSAYTDANLMQRRYRFVQAAVQDAPAFSPGGGVVYGGGTIIVGSMLERLTGKKFEDLMTQQVLQPLGMNSARYGRTSYGELDGTWQHVFNQGLHVPDGATHERSYDFQSHSPAGTLGVTATDMAFLMRELLRPDPQLMSAATRDLMLNSQPTAASPYVLGGWQVDVPHPLNSNQGRRFHAGHNHRSYAYAELYPATGVGFAVFSNVADTIGAAAVLDVHAALSTLESDWNQLFGSGSLPVSIAAHQMPAAVRLGPRRAMVFVRKQDGTVRAFTTTTGGTSWNISTPVPAVFTSGLAAAASTNGQTVYLAGRGSDNRFWVYRSDDSGGSWQLVAGGVHQGTFNSGASIATSADGSVVHLVGLGTDRRPWIASSTDRGAIWSGWTQIRTAFTTATPAVLTTADGAVHLFIRGVNHRIYRARNENWRAGWTGLTWHQMSNDYATSSPVAMVASDGSTLQVGIRGPSRGMFLLSSSDQGQNWQRSFSPVPGGAFTSAPALMANDTPNGVTVFALGTNFRLLQKPWTGTWGDWSFVSNDLFF